MITYFQTKFVCLVIIKLVIPPILSLKSSVSASVNLVWTKSFALWQYNIFLGFPGSKRAFLIVVLASVWCEGVANRLYLAKCTSVIFKVKALIAKQKSDVASVKATMNFSHQRGKIKNLSWLLNMKAH